MPTGNAHERKLPRRQWAPWAILVVACAGGCNDSPSNPAFFSAYSAVAEPRTVATGQPGEWSARPLTEVARYGTVASANRAPMLAVPSLFGPPPDVDPVVLDPPTEEVATLLPPVELPPVDDAPSAEVVVPPPGEAIAVAAAPPADVVVPDAPEIEEEPAEIAAAPLVAESLADPIDESTIAVESAPSADANDACAPALVGTPTGAVVCKRAEAKIRRGYALVQRGATFAARREFIGVLELIAEAKDHKHGAPRRTIALANGLRAIDEAADFESRGARADSRASIAIIVAAHRTPVGKVDDAQGLMPAQLADLYFHYAQLQLGAAVAGEPAGSMALHALGKLHTQLARTEPDNHPQAEQVALALQQAAILARDDNFLAVHELGILLAESGHYAEAECLIGEVAVREPNAVVLRNLARVQRKLGREELAAASEQQAQFYANRDGAGPGAHGVVWVNPATLVRTGDATAPPRAVAAAPPANNPYAPAAAPPAQNANRNSGGWFR
jgi:tetratricopeptide (TPR) repeat protein